MKQLFLILFSCIFLTTNAQDFTLNKKRRNILLISEASAYTVALVGLNQLWYAGYPRSSFHFINDNGEDYNEEYNNQLPPNMFLSTFDTTGYSYSIAPVFNANK